MFWVEMAGGGALHLLPAAGEAPPQSAGVWTRRVFPRQLDVVGAAPPALAGTRLGAAGWRLPPGLRARDAAPGAEAVVRGRQRVLAAARRGALPARPRRLQPLRGPAGQLGAARGRVGGGARGSAGEPGRAGGVAGRQVPPLCAQAPHVQPGTGRPLHGALPAHAGGRRRSIPGAILQLRHRLAER